MERDALQPRNEVPECDEKHSPVTCTAVGSTSLAHDLLKRRRIGFLRRVFLVEFCQGIHCDLDIVALEVHGQFLSETLQLIHVSAGELFDLLATRIELKRRHASDLLGARSFAIVIDVHLGEHNCVLVLFRDAFVMRSDLATRPTTIGIIVDDDWQTRDFLVMFEQFVELFVRADVADQRPGIAGDRQTQHSHCRQDDLEQAGPHLSFVRSRQTLWDLVLL
jgi:hypothetical protein